MEYKDYYKILGVGKSASTDEIKKQYRKLARKYHPDVNPGDKTTASKFADINEAHEVLSDPEKRKKYDSLGANWQQYENFGQNSPFTNRQANGNGTTYTFFEGDMADLFGGGGFSEFFRTFFGDSFGGFGPGREKRVTRGQDYRAELEISFEEAYAGSTKIVNINNENLRMAFKPGLKNGQTIKLKGKGGPGPNGGGKGDLYLTIHVPPHPVYKLAGSDLFIEVPVNVYTLLLGGEKEINVLSGNFKIKIPPETENGKTFRLKGKGFPVYDKPGTFGDLYVKVTITTPRNLSDKEKILIKELADLQEG
ncbi:MAG: J domain-containing protein [Spirochaetales bacterium]|nr:J domain-containing protein [Spirochaetales bacterium]